MKALKVIPEMHENERYHKNVLYISPKEQNNIRDIKIVFAGVGLGSVIAEAALRLGFENFVLIDGDTIELSNLNRQNYDNESVNKSKVKEIVLDVLYEKSVHDPVKPGILKKRLGDLSCSKVRSAKSKLKNKGTHYAKALQRYLNYHCQ